MEIFKVLAIMACLVIAGIVLYRPYKKRTLRKKRKEVAALQELGESANLL